MRALRIAMALLAFSSALAFADQEQSIYAVNMWAIFTATQPCTSNCTETIAASFESQEYFVDAVLQEFQTTVVPGSMSVSANGFLGHFFPGSGFVDDGYFTDIGNGQGDSIALSGIGYVPLGTTVGFSPYMFLDGCMSQPCFDAFGLHQPIGSFIPQTYGASTNVLLWSSVPEPSAFVLLVVPALGFAAWRRLRKAVCST